MNVFPLYQKDMPELLTYSNFANSQKPVQNWSECKRGRPMKRLLVVFAAFLLPCSVAQADQITRTMSAGKTTVVYTYKPRDAFSCEGAYGVATVVARPQHGRIAHHLTSTTFPGDYNINWPVKCHGKPTTGFVVTYTSDPGFHGVDHFTLDVQQPAAHRHWLDAFAIIVE